jgi:TolA-binding protein
MVTRRFDALGALVAERQDAELEGARGDDALRDALAQRAAQRGTQRRRPARAALAAALVGVAAGLAASGSFLLAGGAPEAPPLSFTVGKEARPGVVGEWASAAPSGTLPIRFSDGSAFTLQADARGRVARVAPTGAELVIEAGRAELSVVHREASEWRVRTGPFVVDVTGTRFDVGWRPEADELRVRVYEGSVRVSGCALGSGQSVAAGQELDASCRRGALRVRPIGPEPLAAATNVAPPATPAAPPNPSAHAAAMRRAPRESWQELSRQGSYARAYELAAASGFEAECRRVSGAELLELADAARLSGHSSDADLAYRLLRSRFPGTDGSARAAFALGRAAYQAGRTAEAAQWFQAYLAEQPGGALAAVARGRLLEAYARLGDRDRARAIAKQYLELHPAGPHAEQARKVLGSDATAAP